LTARRTVVSGQPRGFPPTWRKTSPPSASGSGDRQVWPGVGLCRRPLRTCLHRLHCGDGEPNEDCGDAPVGAEVPLVGADFGGGQGSHLPACRRRRGALRRGWRRACNRRGCGHDWSGAGLSRRTGRGSRPTRRRAACWSGWVPALRHVTPATRIMAVVAAGSAGDAAARWPRVDLPRPSASTSLPTGCVLGGVRTLGLNGLFFRTVRDPLRPPLEH
jgi:hypothetical protein